MKILVTGGTGNVGNAASKSCSSGGPRSGAVPEAALSFEAAGRRRGRDQRPDENSLFGSLNTQRKR